MYIAQYIYLYIYIYIYIYIIFKYIYNIFSRRLNISFIILDAIVSILYFNS